MCQFSINELHKRNYMQLVWLKQFHWIVEVAASTAELVQQAE